MSNHSKYPKEAGVYKLTCNKNGKIYIGKSINIRRRLNQHKYCLSRGISKYYFQYVLLKHGWDSFDVEILEIVENFDKLIDNKSLLEREAHYIQLFDSTNSEKGYNICKFSTDVTGFPCSESTKLKIGNANRGKIPSEETREKYRQNNLGKKRSIETKNKMSKSKLGNSNNLGKFHSEETKEKMRLAKIGRKHSEESKEKMRKPKQNKNIKIYE